MQQAFARAAAGKRTRSGVAAFEHQMADHLLELGDELRAGAYIPQRYVHFTIHEPKGRHISAAAFRDTSPSRSAWARHERSSVRAKRRVFGE